MPSLRRALFFLVRTPPVSPNDIISFFPQTGVLFICYFVDYRILHQELTEEIIEDGFQFYATFFNAPPAIKVLSFVV